MRIKSILILTVFVLISQNTFAAKKTDFKKIVFLPFYNYTDSGMNYLSDYIPELLKKNLITEKSIEILDSSDIKNEIKKSSLTTKDLYDKEKAIEFLKTLKADLGLIGRFIIHEKNIQIDYSVLYVTSGQEEKGNPFEGLIDDRFLSTIEKFAITRDAWIKDFILGETFSFKFGNEKNIIIIYYNKIKESKVGKLLLNKWFRALYLILIFYFLSKIIGLLFERIFKKLALKTKTDNDDLIISMSKKPVKWIVIIFGLKTSIWILGLETKLVLFLDNLTIAIMIVMVTYIIIKIFDILIHSWGNKLKDKMHQRLDNEIVPLFIKISKTIFIVICIIMILSRFEIDIAPLVASLGIAGFAIGFAVKDTLSNIIGGIILILDQSFNAGDKVIIDNEMGIIKEVGLRNTKLMTFNNEIIVIPNGELMNKRFKNFVLPDPRIRVVVDFGVAYGSDIDKVEEVVMKVMNEIDGKCEEPEPKVVFTSMGDFALTMQAKFWVPDYINQYDKLLEATKKIYNALNEAGISIPFPTQTVYLKKDEEGK